MFEMLRGFLGGAMTQDKLWLSAAFTDGAPPFILFISFSDRLFRMISTPVAYRDGLLKEAQTALVEKRIGDAVDKYKALADAGDWRGYQGLLDTEADAGSINPNWAGHTEWIAFAIVDCHDRFAKPVNFKASYPDGFSIISAADQMEHKFGENESCRPLVDAVKSAPYNHPYVALEYVASVARSSAVKEEDGKAFVHEFAGKLGIAEETADTLLQQFGLSMRIAVA